MAGRRNNDHFRSTVSQLLASLLFSQVNAGLGLVLAMPTILIGALRSDSSALGLSEEQASWFGSLVYMVQPIGSVLSGFLQDVCGRRKCLMLINIPMLVGWLIIYHATSVTHLFIAELIMGLSIGFMEAPIVSYIGEITQPRLRGVLSSLGAIFYNGGIMVESFLGAAMPWRDMVFYSALAPVASFIMLALVPESPAWLVTKGRHEEAGKAYQWLRGWVGPEDVQEELDTLVNYVKHSQSAQANYKPVATEEGGLKKRKQAPFWKTLLEPEVLMALRIILSFFFVSNCVSLIAIRPFFIEVLDNMHLPYDSYFLVALCTALQMLGALCLGLGFKLIGKRRLSFLALAVSILCCFGLTAYLKLGVYVPWLPVLLFCSSYFFGTFGVIPVPWILTMELFPLRARGLGGGICAAWAYISMFLVIKTYYHLAAATGVSGVCFVYGVIGVLGLIYLYWDMPETEGVSLANIERRFSERHSTRSQKPILNGSSKKDKETKNDLIV